MKVLDWISAFMLTGGMGMALFAMVLTRNPRFEDVGVIVACLGAILGLVGFAWRILTRNIVR